METNANVKNANANAMMNGTNPSNPTHPTFDSVLNAIRNSDTGNLINFASMLSNTITNGDASTLDTVSIQLYTKYWDIQYWEDVLDLQERIYLALKQEHPSYEETETTRGFMLAEDLGLSTLQLYFSDNGLYITIINQNETK